VPLDLPEPPAPPTLEEGAAFGRKLKRRFRRELPKLDVWRELTELRLSRGRSRKAYTDKLITLIATASLYLSLAQEEARRRGLRSDVKAALSHLKKASVTGVKAAGNEDAAWERLKQIQTISSVARDGLSMLGAQSPRGRPRKLALEALVRGLPCIVGGYTGKPHHAECYALLRYLVAPDLEYSSYLRLVRRHR
jgi:hypothetical protein